MRYVVMRYTVPLCVSSCRIAVHCCVLCCVRLYLVVRCVIFSCVVVFRVALHHVVS